MKKLLTKCKKATVLYNKKNIDVIWRVVMLIGGVVIGKLETVQLNDYAQLVQYLNWNFIGCNYTPVYSLETCIKRHHARAAS